MAYELDEIEYVSKIAKRIYNSNNCNGLSVDDLINEGWIALQGAKGKFRPDNPKGATLETFAYKRVSGVMLDLIKSYRPRGYRSQFRAGEPDPVREIEYDDTLNGAGSDMDTHMEMREANTVIISVLNRRERVILMERAAGEKLKPLARRERVSRSRIVQIHRAARAKVRRVLVKKGE